MAQVIVLFLAWITPAIVAGALGWRGIWGTGSALVDYLVPFTVTGGLFHVPSFVVTALAVIYLGRAATPGLARWTTVVAATVLLSAIGMQIDFDDLNRQLFTDLETRGLSLSEENPILLFIATDALWVMLFALAVGGLPSGRQSVLIPLLPAAVVAYPVLMHRAEIAEPINALSYEFGERGEQQGQTIAWVYAPVAFDEQLFRRWVDTSPLVSAPWERDNAQHTAIYFLGSMDAIERRRFTDPANYVGTLCLYEEDRSVIAHRGKADCFAGRMTLVQRQARLLAENRTGLGEDIDQWYARALMCVDVPLGDTAEQIELLSSCRRLHERQPLFIDGIAQRYGENSEQFRFVRQQSAALGLDG